MNSAGLAGQYEDDGQSCLVAPTQTKQNTITPTQIKYRHVDQRQVAAGGAKTAKEITAADLAASLMSMADADMLTVDLTIVGDPEFIKQDDMFYPNTYDSTGQVMLETRIVTPNGSVIMDAKEIFCNLTFKTPTDIDDETGLMSFNTNYRASGFSGLYKILRVDNDFNAGKFTQILHLVRYPDQDAPAESDTASSDQRSDTAGQNGTKGLALPDKVTAPVAKASATEDLVNKAKTEVATTATTSGIDPKLAAIKADAPISAITDTTAPVATTPPPNPTPPLPAGVTQDSSGNYVYKGVTFGGDIKAGMQAVDSNSTVTYNAVDPVSGTVMTHTVDGAALNAAYSTSGQAKSDAQAAQDSVLHVQQVLARDPLTYGTAEQGQQVLAIRQAKADAAMAAYQATLK
jgi:hypothetical protein